MATQTVYDTLKRDHRVLEEIFDRMLDTSDSVIRLQLFNRLKEEFLAHARAEEKLFYQELEHFRGSHDMALEAEEEHHAAERMLRELEATDTADERWRAKVKVLQEMIKHHIEEEENKVFPKAHEVLEEDMEQQLAARFEDQKRRELHRI